MNIIINASVLRRGGGLQVAQSFINECISISEHHYSVFVHIDNFAQFDISRFPPNFDFYFIPRFYFFFLNKYLSKLEKVIKPDIVFSVFGPTYWRPKARHVIGFAHGYYIYPESPYWDKVSFQNKIIMKIKKEIHLFYFRRDGDVFIAETDDASTRVEALLKKKCYTVSNTWSAFFDNPLLINTFRFSNQFSNIQNSFKLLYVCNNYEHKNIKIIPSVVDQLKNKGVFNVRFILTIDECSYSKIVSNKYVNDILSLGTIDNLDCPSLYRKCDAVFVPTLLECFTANYPEAFKSGKPVITSDLPFAHTICGNAAFYFDPLNPSDIADKIIVLLKNRYLYEKLIDEGYNAMKKFPSAHNRALSYLEICKNNC